MGGGVKLLPAVSAGTLQCDSPWWAGSGGSAPATRRSMMCDLWAAISHPIHAGLTPPTCTGQAAPSPRAQMVCPSICLLISQIISISDVLASPRTNLHIILFIQSTPVRRAVRLKAWLFCQAALAVLVWLARLFTRKNAKCIIKKKY